MKNDRYYLGNSEELPTVLDMKNTDRSIHIEMPWDANMEDLCQAFYTACIGLTFLPGTVVQGMKDFVEEHSDLTDNEEEE